MEILSTFQVNNESPGKRRTGVLAEGPSSKAVPSGSHGQDCILVEAACGHHGVAPGILFRCRTSAGARACIHRQGSVRICEWRQLFNVATCARPTMARLKPSAG